ncbi:MAG: DUF2490 domain-containing protein [Vampirovibrionales bacterium]|nr:DUF2490 domain-containing protein [Vampirovibrionales bacterium]
MKQAVIKLSLCGLLFSACLFLSAWAELDSADPAKNNTHAELWTPVTLKLPVTERWGISTMTLPLLRQDEGGLTRIQTRGGVYYQPTPRLEIGASVDYIPTFNKNTNLEWRLGQQAVYTQPLGKRGLTWRHRTRLEQRWTENTPFRHRLRLRNRFSMPVPKHPRWYGFAEQELHLNIGKEQAGFDQHRLYTGIGKQLTSYCSIEGGYQWIYTNTSNPNNQQNVHVAIVQVLLQTPTLFKKPSTSTRITGPNQPKEEAPITDRNPSIIPSASPFNDY